jgi:hypothetical protein
VIDEKSTSSNAEPSINRTPRGITIDRSAACENASASIRMNREFDSNETDSSVGHQEKHPEPRISQLRGIKIDQIEEYENALDSIRLNREFDSNETDLSDRHQEKHPEQRISTVRGIRIV